MKWKKLLRDSIGELVRVTLYFSLLTAGLASFLWWRTSQKPFSFAVQHNGMNYDLSSSGGYLNILKLTQSITMVPNTRRDELNALRRQLEMKRRELEELQNQNQHWTKPLSVYPPAPDVFHPIDPAPSLPQSVPISVTTVLFSLHYITLIMMAAIVPLCFLTAFTIRVGVRAKQRATRNKQNLCRTCGYDLRAGHERCPECGSECAFAPSPSRERAGVRAWEELRNF